MKIFFSIIVLFLLFASHSFAADKTNPPIEDECGESFDGDDRIRALVKILSNGFWLPITAEFQELTAALNSDPETAKRTAEIIIEGFADLGKVKDAVHLANALFVTKDLDETARRAFAEAMEPALSKLVQGDNGLWPMHSALAALGNLPVYASKYQDLALKLAKMDASYTYIAHRFLGHGGVSNVSYLPWIDEVIQNLKMSQSDGISWETVDAREAIIAYAKIASPEIARAKISQIILTHPKAAMRYEAVLFVAQSDDRGAYIDTLRQALSDKGIINFNVGAKAALVLTEMKVDFSDVVTPSEKQSAGQKTGSSRKFSEISIEALKATVEAALNKKDTDINGLPYLTVAIEADLAKVKFETQSVFIESMTFPNEVPYNDELSVLGYHKLENGLSFLGAASWSGDDGMPPVFFIIYWDGKSLRGYIPEDGNMWNTDTKKAFGYGFDRDADLENIKKRYPENDELTEIDYYMDIKGLQFDDNALRDDILNRFERRSK